MERIWGHSRSYIMGTDCICYKCDTQNHRVPQGVPHKAESPITSFILFFFFLVLIFLSFFSDTIFIETKLILFFLSTKQKTFLKKHLFYFFSFCNSRVTSSCHSPTSTACDPNSNIFFWRSRRRPFPFETRPSNSEIVRECFGRGTWGSSSGRFSRARWLGALGAGAETDTRVRGGCGTSFDDRIMETTD